MLAKFYTDLNAAGKKMEIVFASCDNTDKEYEEYTGTMPWKAIPFASPNRTTLGDTYKVGGIPTLAILDKAGNLLVADAYEDVQKKGVAAFNTWLALKK